MNSTKWWVLVNVVIVIGGYTLNLLRRNGVLEQVQIPIIICAVIACVLTAILILLRRQELSATTMILLIGIDVICALAVFEV